MISSLLSGKSLPVRRLVASSLGLSISCDERARLWPVYLAGKLTSWQERLALEVHLHLCRDCQLKLGRVRRDIDMHVVQPEFLRSLDGGDDAVCQAGEREGPILPMLPVFDKGMRRVSAAYRTPYAVGAAGSEMPVKERVLAKINEIPESYRIVLQLHDIERMDSEQISGILGLSESVVRKRLHRARAALTTLCQPFIKEEP